MLPCRSPSRAGKLLACAALGLLGCDSGTRGGPAPKPEKPAPKQPADRGNVVINSDGVFARVGLGTETTLSPAEEAEARRVAALGYAGGVERAKSHWGVRVHDRSRAYPGLNLYTSGHAPVATLMDMDGKVLHEWRFDFSPEMTPEARADSRQQLGTKHMRRAHLFPNGDLLVLYDYAGIARIDVDSRKIWALPGRFHHDLAVLPDGRILTITEIERPASDLGYEGTVLDNILVVLDSGGEELERYSLLDCFKNTFDEKSLRNVCPAERLPDVFHANSLELLDGSLAYIHPSLGADHVLVSIRTLSVLVSIDLRTNKVAKLFTGPWRGQHEARVQPDGHLLVFDNLGMTDHSRILNLDLKTLRVTTEYESTPPTDFFSRFQGTERRLPNGDLLVTESTGGRAFELSPQKQIVWEFLSPHRFGGDLVAVLFDLERVDAKDVGAWLK